jgi:hypothetical protein
MDVTEFTWSLFALGFISLAIIGVVKFYQNQHRNDPANGFKRSNGQLVAVYSPEGNMKFQSYDPNRFSLHAESENYMSVGEHARITHVMDEPMRERIPMTVVAGGGGGGSSIGDMRVPFRRGVEPVVLEQMKPVVVTPQEIAIHKPSDRFLDIVGE